MKVFHKGWCDSGREWRCRVPRICLSVCRELYYWRDFLPRIAATNGMTERQTKKYRQKSLTVRLAWIVIVLRSTTRLFLHHATRRFNVT
jgi:hypothetical protein